jgi:hypothetical protein
MVHPKDNKLGDYCMVSTAVYQYSRFSTIIMNLLDKTGYCAVRLLDL